MPLGSVNFTAVAIAAIAAWLFGAVYYTALATPWHTAQGKTLAQCKAEQAGKSAVGRAAPFILCFLAEVVMGVVLYGILVHLNSFTIRAGLISAAFCWFGFVLTTLSVNNAFANRKAFLTAIDAGHWLGALLVIGGILGWMGR